MISLPSPDPQAQSISEQLIVRIRNEQQANGGVISFARFMELALYEPGLGYYTGGMRKFGEGGDFVTAPEISTLFSRCVARQCAEVLASLGGGSILEFGAGSGRMAADILMELDELDATFDHYYIIELSADLSQRQLHTISERVPRLASRVKWLERLPDSGFRGVVLANEVLDAMPVHRFTLTEQGIAELYVGIEDGRFVWKQGPPSVAQIASLPGEFGVQAEWVGYTSEINLAAPAWVRSISALMAAGLVLVIDYGFPRHEFYHPDRAGGTLMCHYRHHAHADPLVLVGLQDITAHVDFTALAEAAQESGMEVAGFTTQGQFLLASGLVEMMAESEGDVRVRAELAQQIKKLTLPHEMGELFKVMALTRNLDASLSGFGLRDLRARL